MLRASECGNKLFSKMQPTLFVLPFLNNHYSMESVILDDFPSYVHERTTTFLSVRDECVAKQIVLVALRSQNSLVEEALRM
jgi:hypothetical protein